MKENEVQAVQTTWGTLEYYLDGGCGGAVRMLNPRTVERYEALRSEHPNPSEHHVFIASDYDEYEKGYNDLVARGIIHEGDEIAVSAGHLYGPREGIDSFYASYAKRRERIAKECDPQEVYFYEYNNLECMKVGIGDGDALGIVEHIFGAEVAQTVKRIRRKNF